MMRKRAVSLTLEAHSHELLNDVMVETGIKYKSQAQDLINKVVQCEIDIDTILYYYTTYFKNSKEYGRKKAGL